MSKPPFPSGRLRLVNQNSPLAFWLPTGKQSASSNVELTEGPRFSGEPHAKSSSGSERKLRQQSRPPYPPGRRDAKYNQCPSSDNVGDASSAEELTGAPRFTSGPHVPSDCLLDTQMS